MTLTTETDGRWFPIQNESRTTVRDGPSDGPEDLDMTCPDCRGTKERAGIGCGLPRCRPIVLPCPTCTGTGEISGERARWVAEGRRLHRYRLGRESDAFPVYTSMLNAAVRHGVTLGQWADAEAGRADPAPLIARVLEGA